MRFDNATDTDNDVTSLLLLLLLLPVFTGLLQRSTRR
jgi:hypothetical protein